MDIQNRTLFFGDNLDILKDKIPESYVDLIYLDPPFQSSRSYNQIFQPEQGAIKGATAQIQAFKDTWAWGPEAEKDYDGLITGEINKERPSQRLIDLMKAMRGYLGETPIMAYLSMMAPRLWEMRRVLKNTGSIYLHCDPTASHYLKLLMDATFGVENFRNEIVWVYARPAAPNQKIFTRGHQVIFFYTKSDNWSVNLNEVRQPYKESTIARAGYMSSAHGRKFVREIHKEGKIPEDWWEIPYLRPNAQETTGYPTQKPEKLLTRIVKASSNKGDLVLDPFCGCGTTIAVAQRFGRRWIGIDITYLAIDVIAKRLEKNRLVKNTDFKIEGEPKDLYSAEKLARYNPFEFQVWCILKLNATPSPTKSGDQGVDGTINFVDLTKGGKVGKGIVQVKGTQVVGPGMVRDLKGTIKSQNADFGILVTLKKPTQGMIIEATREGYYQLEYVPNRPQYKIPKIQFLTVDDLLGEPISVILPPIIPPYKKPAILEATEQQSFL